MRKSALIVGLFSPSMLIFAFSAVCAQVNTPCDNCITRHEPSSLIFLFLALPAYFLARFFASLVIFRGRIINILPLFFTTVFISVLFFAYLIILSVTSSSLVNLSNFSNLVSAILFLFVSWIGIEYVLSLWLFGSLVNRGYLKEVKKSEIRWVTAVGLFAMLLLILFKGLISPVLIFMR